MIVLEIVGHPAPKGSPRVVRRGKNIHVLKDSKKTETWHKCVACEALAVLGDRQLPIFCDQALRVRLEFRLRRPVGHFGKRGLRPSARPHPSVKPDLDKLVRATLDPLEGVVFDGDSRIVAIDATKRYLETGEAEGARIEISLMESTPCTSEKPRDCP